MMRLKAFPTFREVVNHGSISSLIRHYSASPTLVSSKALHCAQCRIQTPAAGGSFPGGLCSTCFAKKQSIISPSQIFKALSDTVIGQEEVKRTLSVSAFLHLNRVKANHWLGIKSVGRKEKQQQQQPSVDAMLDQVMEFMQHLEPLVDLLDSMIKKARSNARIKKKASLLLKRIKSNPHRITPLVDSLILPPVLNQDRQAIVETIRFTLANAGELHTRQRQTLKNEETMPLSRQMEILRLLHVVKAKEELIFQARVLWFGIPLRERLASLQSCRLDSKQEVGKTSNTQRSLRSIQVFESLIRSVQLDKDVPLVMSYVDNFLQSISRGVRQESLKPGGPVMMESFSIASQDFLSKMRNSPAIVVRLPPISMNTPKQATVSSRAPSLSYLTQVDALKDLHVSKFEKSNVLLLGPTGSGKTLLVKTLAKCLQVPMVICDATSLTATGYHGDDVDTVLYKLWEAADYNLEKAQQGIVVLDEVDKLATNRHSERMADKDIGGESVQHALLKMLEGSKVKLIRPNNKKSSWMGDLFGPEEVYMDTSNILFIGSGAFTRLDSIVATRTFAKVLGFSSSEKTRASFDETTSDFAERETLMQNVETCDLIEFGLIPEFVGRFNMVTHTKLLTEEDLERILTDPVNSIVNQMRALFWVSFPHPVTLVFTPQALRGIARKALSTKSGARGLRVIVEQVCRHSLFTLADKPHVTHLVINQEGVESMGTRCLEFTTQEYNMWCAGQTKTGVVE